MALSHHERRILEAPLLLELAVQAAGETSPRPEVGWRDDGKHMLVGAGAGDIQLSLAHDGSHCLCAVGSGHQGCDIESVAARSREEWLRLLGPHHE